MSSAHSTIRETTSVSGSSSKEPDSVQQSSLEAPLSADSKADACHVVYDEPWEEFKQVDLHYHLEHWEKMKQRRAQGTVEFIFFKLLINRRYLRVLVATTNFMSAHGSQGGLGNESKRREHVLKTTPAHPVSSPTLDLPSPQVEVTHLNLGLGSPHRAIIGNLLLGHYVMVSWI
ncbi:hypothetical protein CBR_g48567 [Chara braunii]|uniref:Uncharacterized protein n=1 Tax=Chara braunii TaxID=69332 RepID=A0A388M300_CHABU|nr:hypothetical protein CBR_g48567 [Chara braunii]|eukprot:GBG88957.1 hypothetical protein CBR_g48567 [Chara braunii]